ncbi:Alpha/Beta hydrolase protein [Pseudomassariella vexata]|uniref:Alpha/Beta hydrolase protein n=1 Tax=Pseudomassariella vexata TaxID=1141098 RepID=A0A1Y2EJL3_9PEZI|nr:Alpha/Beta hydrolase protein [Pseudomassariella vexata]ORY71749.1 Alpha/Beta hydrolase protein [Pseudomassariella vexata]
MVTETEGSFTIGDVSLHTKTWMPDGPPKAKVIMVHGFNDHVDRYYDFFPTLARAGIAVYGFDQRGWGRSVKHPSQRGLTGPTSLVIADIAAFIRLQLPSPVPIFVLGHSMGGGEVLTLASSPEYEDLITQVRGWILEAPFIAFAPEETPGWFKVLSGKLASRLLPHFHLEHVIPPEHVVRDADVQQSIRDDNLLHNMGTLEGLASLLERTDNLFKRKVKLSPKVKSLVIMHGDHDKACSYERAKEWFEAQSIEDGQFKTYEGFYHQLHADPGKEGFYQDVVNWILKRVGPEADSSRVPTITTTAPTPLSENAPNSKL